MSTSNITAVSGPDAGASPNDQPATGAVSKPKRGHSGQRRPAPLLGPYSQIKGRLDLRTRLGRRAAEFERGLVAHLGGAPTVTQMGLIRLASTLDIRIELMRGRLLATEEGDERAERHMLAWANTLARTLKLLGWRAAAEKPPSIADYLADKGRQRPETGATAASATLPGAERGSPEQARQRGAVAGGDA
jgi:hypothetical protein